MGRRKSAVTRQQLNTMVLPEILAAIDAIADENMRTRSNVAEFMLKRGLAAYKRDKLLDEPVKQPLIVDLKENVVKKKAS